MKVAVITPYHDQDNPHFLQCINSVQNQSYQNIIHVTIGDGCTSPEIPLPPNVYNISLPQNINNFGDSPRSIGVVYAFSLGADAVTFLDSDNWFALNHIEAMVQQCRSHGSEVVTCFRRICHLDGSEMGTCPESDGIIFCDTNCLLVTKTLAEEAALWWLIPEDMHVIDDRVMWDTLIHATDRISSTKLTSVFYRSAFEFHYRMFGVALPQNTKAGDAIGALGDVIDSLQMRAKARGIARQSKLDR